MKVCNRLWHNRWIQEIFKAMEFHLGSIRKLDFRLHSKQLIYHESIVYIWAR
jgi:hypothetical protein